MVHSRPNESSKCPKCLDNAFFNPYPFHNCQHPCCVLVEGLTMTTVLKSNAQVSKTETFPLSVSQLIPLGEIESRLEQSYESRGWAKSVFHNDMSLLRRLGVHPQEATLEDCERLVLTPAKSNSRGVYAARLISMFRHMNKLGLIKNNPTEDLTVVRKTKTLPRPLTEQEAAILMETSNEPMRSWFILGCFAGLRAMEVSGLLGSDLELGDDGYTLRVRGKGNTDLVIPAHPAVVEVIQARGTLGRLWKLCPNKVSSYASDEMARLGVNKKFHSCRHYFATSAMKASGGDLLVVRDLMRHASVATTQQYTLLERSRPTEVVNLLSMPMVQSA